MTCSSLRRSEVYVSFLWYVGSVDFVCFSSRASLLSRYIRLRSRRKSLKCRRGMRAEELSSTHHLTLAVFSWSALSARSASFTGSVCKTIHDERAHCTYVTVTQGRRENSHRRSQSRFKPCAGLSLAQQAVRTLKPDRKRRCPGTIFSLHQQKVASNARKIVATIRIDSTASTSQPPARHTVADLAACSTTYVSANAQTCATTSQFVRLNSRADEACFCPLKAAADYGSPLLLLTVIHLELRLPPHHLYFTRSSRPRICPLT